MKNLLLFVAISLLFISETISAQTPHVKGTIAVSTQNGTLQGDVTISNLPRVENYVILLNKGLNIEFLRNEDKKVNYYFDSNYDEEVSEEGFQYFIPNDDRTGKFLPKELRIKYTGAFPVINNYTEAYEWGDWKGNIAFRGNTLRASEQSVWYPVLYDVANDQIINKYTYDLTIKTELGNSIYLNGSAPTSKNEATLTSSVPVSLLLFAGEFSFSAKEGIYIVNGKLDAEKEQTLSIWTNTIIDFYEKKLEIDYGQTVTYLGAHPTSIKNGWMFVTYPTIAIIGNDRWSFAGYFDEKTHEWIDESNTSFIAHELGHYYFGTLFIPNDTLRWAFLEGMTEYISLQAVREILGDETYQKKLQSYAENSNDLEVIGLPEITQFREINETYRYNYFPLLINALETEIGEKAVWNWCKVIIRSKNQNSNYQFFKDTLLESGVSGEEFKNFELKYITSKDAKKNVMSLVSE